MNPLVASFAETASPMTALSVNLNKVALLRNSRALGVPSVTRAAIWALQAGAQGITVHPRPDERHIRLSDVVELSALLQDYPHAEFNIEGNPFHNLMDIVRQVRPNQCTLVPDATHQATSDHGWDLLHLSEVERQRLRGCIQEAQDLGVRVSLFMDPDPLAMVQARELGAQRIELYTESYAHSHGQPQQAQVLAGYQQSAVAAQKLGLEVNAGHDLNLDNLTDFLKAVPGVLEVSIGHALIADALEQGMTATVGAYLARIRAAYA
jgi:pyridoxine 5-phosphate synthase